MGAANILRLLEAALNGGHTLDMSKAVKVLPTSDDPSVGIQVGDGTTDVDVQIFLGSSTEDVLFDVGNSRVDFNVPIRMADGGAVTQATSITTGVTLNTLSGQITTVSQTIAAAAEATFTVTNSKVAVNDTVIVNIQMSDGNGTFIAAVTTVAAGSFDITLANLHASAAGNDEIILNFSVIKGSSS